MTEERTLGIDVSHWQGKTLDWPAIAKSGVAFTFNKASQDNFVDGAWDRNASEAKRAGLLVGSYHFFVPTKDPDAQAEFYFKTAGKRCDLPPVVDFESSKGMHQDDVAHRVYRFVMATEALWGRRCIIYTYPNFIRELRAQGAMSSVGRYKFDELGSRDLWIAHYTKSKPTIPAPWHDWVFWQYDGDGGQRLPNGTDCDFNWFKGSLAELQAYAAGEEKAPDTRPESPTSKSSQRLQALQPVEVPNAGDFVRTLADADRCGSS